MKVVEAKMATSLSDMFIQASGNGIPSDQTELHVLECLNPWLGTELCLRANGIAFRLISSCLEARRVRPKYLLVDADDTNRDNWREHGDQSSEETAISR